MAIQEIGPRVLRNEIGFFDEDPPHSEKDMARLGGFNLTRMSEGDLDDPNQLIRLSAAIFRQRADKPNQIARDFNETLSTLLTADVRIFINPAEVEPGKQMPLMRQGLIGALETEKFPVSGGESTSATMLTPSVHVLRGPNAWEEVVEFLQKYPPGHAPNSDLELKVWDIKSNEITLDLEDMQIVRRSFWNCSKLTLVENQEGRSGVLTFRAYATRAGDPAGTGRPYEYFVKVGNREQISKEYRAYRQNALEHIPYHLGPRLRMDRCALGPSRGIIACDYVNGAEKLRDCAKEGRAVPIIANLFNTTMRTWRDNAILVDHPLSQFLKDRMPEKIPRRRQAKIKKLGQTHTAKQLSEMVQSLESSPVMVGFVHGDLHALNVLVRGSDAIVIDFEKAEDRAPLLLDLASLESGLFVDGFIREGRSSEDLLRSVECLYTGAALLNGQFDLCHPSDGSAWFFDCARQIRMHAPQIEGAPGQYALTLAVEFGKKACKDYNFAGGPGSKGKLTGEDVRACAYVLAQKILTELTNASGGVTPS
jgi:hypothetical protein